MHCITIQSSQIKLIFQSYSSSPYHHIAHPNFRGYFFSLQGAKLVPLFVVQETGVCYVNSDVINSVFIMLWLINRTSIWSSKALPIFSSSQRMLTTWNIYYILLWYNHFPQISATSQIWFCPDFVTVLILLIVV